MMLSLCCTGAGADAEQLMKEMIKGAQKPVAAGRARRRKEKVAKPVSAAARAKGFGK